MESESSIEVFKRPNKHEHFLNRAKVAAERSTCLRRRVGAIIVKDGVELSSGYVGSPRSSAHCIDIRKCLRYELKIPSGERYELCRSVHAEQNAIINAARIGVSITGSEMYISSEKNNCWYSNQEGKQKQVIYAPCIICKKQIINSGIKKVYMHEINVGKGSYSADELCLILEQEESELRYRFNPTKDLGG